jgi:hypothetical protein
MSMKVICAWCKKVMKDGTEPASHGICPPCREKHFGGELQAVALSYQLLDPIEHAASMIETCHGDAHEALQLAELNVQFAPGRKERDYWDRVSTAIVFQSTAELLS